MAVLNQIFVKKTLIPRINLIRLLIKILIERLFCASEWFKKLLRKTTEFIALHQFKSQQFASEEKCVLSTPTSLMSQHGISLGIIWTTQRQKFCKNLVVVHRCNIIFNPSFSFINPVQIYNKSWPKRDWLPIQQ